MRRIPIPLLMLALSAPAFGEALLPGDAASGKKLYDTQCTSCHDTGVHTRKDRKVKTLPGLIGQVNQCNQQLDRRYNDAQINDLIAYLNSSFYKFDD